MRFRACAFASAVLLFAGAPASAETLTVATVNNGDMIRMQELTPEFEKAHPGIEVNWITLEENVLRERVTTDIATKGGKFDILTIGTYEVPIWAKQGWLVPLDGLGADYDVDDLLPSIRAGLSHAGTLFAAPFYGESSFIMYRRDLMAKAGLAMPEAPTWDFVADAARRMTDRAAGVNGICLRGKAGWGENVALLTALANSFDAPWFDANWRPQFDRPEWKRAIGLYVDLMKTAGPKDASSNGFNENLALFRAGKCGMWIDATVAASFVTDPAESTVAGEVGFALAPDAGLGKRANWLWAWSLAIPTGTQKADAAEKFVAWATGKGYAELLASRYGWANVPPGTRASLYANADYRAAAPFAQLTIDSINLADPGRPTVKPVPYTGVQFVAIPEFQGLGTRIGQLFSAALAGTMPVDAALKQAQTVATREMVRSGYLK